MMLPCDPGIQRFTVSNSTSESGKMHLQSQEWCPLQNLKFFKIPAMNLLE